MHFMIPKAIHYCWFGHNPLPEQAKKCIDSWKLFFPDCDIVEWNESNFDISIVPFVAEAYKLKKWAFVSDYARFWILYNYGGLYFDTDVEVIKNMDPIVAKGPFIGCEKNDNSSNVRINAGLGLGAEKGMKFYQEILEIYNNLHIVTKLGLIQLHSVVDIVSEYLERHGAEKKDIVQSVCGVNIFPTEYFCPKDYYTGQLKITENTYCIHHYDASWVRPHHLEVCEIPFWNFFHLRNYQILWRLRNILGRYRVER